MKFITGIVGSLIFSVTLASPPFAQDCPSLAVDETAAQHWSITWNEEEWMHQATLLTSNPASETKIQVSLETDGAVDPEVLSWIFPDRYEGRVGVLHYYSGSAGTHAMADFSRIAVIDMRSNTLIANPVYSTEVEGTRYHEQADGTLIETSYYYCDVGNFVWLADRFAYSYDGEITFYHLQDTNPN